MKKKHKHAREVVIGGTYLHFKGGLYRAEAIARDSETDEPVVVYRALYGDGGLWVRPLDMFLSKVDRKKYPKVNQRYRFELVGEDVAKRFPYGMAIEPYLDKAAEVLREERSYRWATRKLFRKQYRYAIEQEKGKYRFVRYVKYSKKDIEREVLSEVKTAEQFIELVANDNELTVFYANEVVEVYAMDFPQIDLHGWNLERYEFHKHESGDYSAFVQAGDQVAGASRDFVIPPEYLEGTFDEFLEQYAALVPGGAFGLYPEDLAKDEGLKAFLGF